MAKKVSMLFGVVFVIVGLLGFVSNPIVGREGFFMTDVMHDIVHILVGVIMLVASGKGEGAAVMSLKVFGVIYLLLAILGFLMPGAKLIGILSANTADHVLHLVLGVVLLGAAMMNKGGSAPATPTPMAP